MPTPLAARLQALENTLQQAKIAYQSLSPMADTGLAHDHVWVHRDGDDWVARLPKQSQMNLAPAENLAYEAACYERASQGGQVPRLHDILPVSDALPRGGLLVDAIEGRWRSCRTIYHVSQRPWQAYIAYRYLSIPNHY